ncbi:E1 [Rousettus aegyptiacus papillomavirus 1]|uniref:Replication protein E1 n=1 Tax=Rousettus aegyptiacus papillomavirus 1 TaxID=369584 RepID=Q0QIH9_9PAPI|nr:E1 [Rousettus aegyptiacus papillomavirus 1]ABC95026.1 E1 [Rousettus aegyptiacus papillomavirus 1]
MASQRGTDPEEGTSGLGGIDFIDREAVDSDGDLSGGDEDSDGSSVSNLFDETDQSPGNPLQLLQQQEAAEDERLVALIKRKHLTTPEYKSVQALSPKLDAMKISPRPVPAKKKLFHPEDSGVGVSVSLELSDEVEDGALTLLTQVEGSGGAQSRSSGDGAEEEVAGGSGESPTIFGREGGIVGSQKSGVSVQDEEDSPASGEGGDKFLAAAILRAANRRVCMLARFKEVYGVSVTDLTRQFKSDKTCCKNWVVVIFGLCEPYYITLTGVLPDHCCYSHMQRAVSEQGGGIALMLCDFKAMKNRDTVIKLIKSLVPVSDDLIMVQPPNVRSPAAALYWVQRAQSNASECKGEYPSWITKQTMLSHMLAEDVTFDFSNMVQWAYDQGYTEESKIAYHYAQLAEEDKNAMAWLSSAAQAQHVKHCAQMVRYYMQAQTAEMTMAQYIHERIEQVEGEGDWKHIIAFLRHQDIEIIPWLRTTRDWLKGIPKRNCVCYHGPPDTGKSMFGMSLMRFMRGAIISYVNSRSHFWLQPLVSAKVAMLDDATDACWQYIDTNLRNLLDGNPLSFDLKHRAPIQATCPPLLITSNIDITQDDKHKYLRSRVKCFAFHCPLPVGEDGMPTLVLTEASWKCFFRKFASTLEVALPEEEEDGDSQRSFRCSARSDSGSL